MICWQGLGDEDSKGKGVMRDCFPVMLVVHCSEGVGPECQNFR